MAYNTNEVLKDVDGNPISQYYDPISDSYKPVEGSGGGNKVNVENNQGLSLIPILDKLSQLTGTVIDEESRKSNETTRKSNESSRVSAESDRVSAENTRVSNENTRKTQESDRVSAESSRVNVESSRVSAENTRVSNEDTRKSNESTRESSEAIRVSNEDIRKSNESTRQSSETVRNTNEDARIDNEDERIANESSREQKESTREDNESTRQSNENIRTNNELSREDSETVRQANMEIVQGWINNPEQFDGRDLEFTWRGAELGVRLEGDTDYVYVDLKGETGSIENLTEQHVINALGFTPLSEDSLPSNLETTSGSQTKADAAESNAKDYADVGLADKVDKVSGKGLSTNDYTTAEKNKLSGVETGAEVNAVTSVAGKTGAVTVSKSDVGLSNVENLSAASIRSGTTKANVGLSNVDNIKQMPISGGVLENYREKLTILEPMGRAIDLSLGNVFEHTPSEPRSYRIDNAPSGAHSFTLIINMDATVKTLFFPSSVKWQGGEIPDMSTVGKTYLLTFITVNGGSTWLGMFGGEF